MPLYNDAYIDKKEDYGVCVGCTLLNDKTFPAKTLKKRLIVKIELPLENDCDAVLTFRAIYVKLM